MLLWLGTFRKLLFHYANDEKKSQPMVETFKLPGRYTLRTKVIFKTHGSLILYWPESSETGEEAREKSCTSPAEWVGGHTKQMDEALTRETE
jgi:hypothetical protein